MINSSTMGRGRLTPLALLLLLPALVGAVLPIGEIRFKSAPGYTYASMAVRAVLRFWAGVVGGGFAVVSCNGRCAGRGTVDSSPHTH